MLTRLLGLLLLPSLCSAMLVANPSANPTDPNEEVTDPNTHYMSGRMASDATPNPYLRSGDNNYTYGRHNALPVGPDADGPHDLALCDMLMDSPAPLPMDQVPWFCICSKCKNNVGLKGDRGDRGLPGPPGSPGRRGLMGFRGRPGFFGRQGVKGQKGDEGEKGQRGMAGFSGTKGDRGFKGDKGDRGLEGPQGELGPQGETGICPATCDSVRGPPGQVGVPGPAGARGLPGVEGAVGPKGDKGDKGDLGVPGVPGLDGDKGDQGEQGLCNCTDGVDGADGKQGPLGAKGDKGDVGSQGVQGPTGDKGDMGDMGMNGPRGPCSPAIQSAFSASLTESYPDPNMPIPFLRVLINVMMNFDPSRGIYHAPVNGTYVFSFHMAVQSKVLKVGLFHNFMPIVKTTESTNMATASHQVVLHLSQGDQVWLQVKDTSTNGMYTDEESSSTFSGYLLHPDSCDMPLGRQFVQPLKGSYSWGGSNSEPGTTTPGP